MSTLSKVKILGGSVTDIFNFVFIAVLLSLPAIILKDWILFSFPLIIAIILSRVYGERFIIALVLISLFTLIGDISRTLRTIVQLTDLSLIGYLFLKRYGLNFSTYKSVPKSVIYFLILYFSAMLLASIFSEFPFAGVNTIINQLIFFILVYLFYSLIDDEADVKNYFTSIIIVACILVSVSLISFYLEGYTLTDIIVKDRTRVSGIMSNFEASSNFFVIAVPILISIVLTKKNRSKLSSLSWMIILFIIVGLILSMSRSAIIGIVISSLIVFFMLKRKQFYRFLIFLAFIILLFMIYPPLNEFVTLLFRIEEGYSARDSLWAMSIAMIKDHPVFGIGPGVYNHELFNYFPFMLDNFYGRVFIYFSEVANGVNLAHNIFLVLFVDLGILGLLTSIFLPIIYFTIGIKTIKKYKEKSQYVLIIGIFAAGTSVIFRNILNSIGLIYVGGVYTDLPFWLIFSSIVYFYKKAPKSYLLKD